MQKKRSYQQYCPLSFSLDVIGDRWTLLIVRELSLGARRFSDIQRGLPGIGPNLLSTRLRELSEHAVIEQEHLPPPAKASVYQLTERGFALLAATMPLAQWGMPYLTLPPADHLFMSTIAMIGGMGLMFTEDQAVGISAEIRLLPDVFSIIVSDRTVETRQGNTPNLPLVIEAATKTLFNLTWNLVTPEEALASGDLLLKRGDLVLLKQFLGQFQPLTQI